ncbi:Sec-independent protein translocase protein TatB [Rhodoblastus sp.]|uniref:Sec-independent protein translocase protein TatB n=1 Tax=Rhodoblastus sp. TaxID=1962975 RepID=UPI002629621B|nr:Sec-independent protein translocase protein TatB [Rhodoblastus sp.]
MFDFDVGKLLLIGVVALIFIPPKDLPEALRMLGRVVGQARRMASEFQSQFTGALREAELSQLKTDLQDLKEKSSMEGALTRMADMLESQASAKIAPAESAPAAIASAEAAAVSPPSPGLIIVEDEVSAANLPPAPEAAATPEPTPPAVGKAS